MNRRLQTDGGLSKAHHPVKQAAERGLPRWGLRDLSDERYQNFLADRVTRFQERHMRGCDGPRSDRDSARPSDIVNGEPVLDPQAYTSLA